MQRCWPGNLYYDRVSEPSFLEEIGTVFETYVGRHLQLLEPPGLAKVYPAVRYTESGVEEESVDWIAVFPEMVLLVEAKTSRLTAESRLGLDRLSIDIERTLGTAYGQLQRSASLIREGRSEFSYIPVDRPLLGFAVTLEPYWLFEDPALPTPRPYGMEIHTVSIHEIEVLVQAALAGPIQPALDALSLPVDGQARRVRKELAALPRVGNPILDAAFDQLLPRAGHEPS
jgi:hypothetical protein